MSRREAVTGREWLRWVERGAFSLVLLAGIAALGQIPLGRPSGQAVVRLALRSTKTRIEVCRHPSEAELAALPAHMRRSEICDWVAPPYRLHVAIDGRQMLDRIVDAGGLKADRPRTVDAEVTLAPGRVRLEVRYEPRDPPAEPAGALLPTYRLDEVVDLEADRVTLVQLDDRRGLLVYRGS